MTNKSVYRGVFSIFLILGMLGAMACGGGGPSAPKGTGTVAGVTMGSDVDNLSSYFPEDTLFYTTIENVPEFKSNFEKTLIFAAIKDSPEVQGMIQGALSQLDSELQENFGKTWMEVLDMFPGEVAFGVISFDPSREDAEMGIAIEVGDNQAEFEQILNKIISNTGQATYKFVNGVLIMGVKSETVEKMAAAANGEVKALASEGKYQTARGDIPSESVVFSYGDLEGFLNLIFEEMDSNASMGGRPNRELETMLKLGFEEMVLAYTGSTMDAEGSAAILRLVTDSEKKGLLKVLDRPAGETESVRFVPQEASLFAAINFDEGSKLWEDFKHEFLFNVMSEREVGRFDSEMAGFQSQFGFDLEKDLFGNIGGEASICFGQINDPSSFANFLGAIEVQDESKAMEIVDSIFKVGEKYNEVTNSTSNYKGNDIHTATFRRGGISMHYTTYDSYFLISGNQLQLQRSLDQADSGGSLGDSEAYDFVMSRLDAQSNIRVYVQPKNLMSGMESMARMFRMPGPVGEVIPMFGLLTMQPYLKGMGATLTSLDDGLALKTFNSAGIPGSVMAMAPFLGVVAAPNVFESQTRAKVARSKADLRTMAVALESYFVDNNRYPDEGNLGVLTTPIAYITSLPSDTFATGQKLKYKKTGDNDWIMYSVGPDMQDNNADTIYDPTNGTISIGDIIRVRQ